MPSRTQKNPADFIVPINMNGLRGRMLRMPAPKKKHKEILLVYGHHASLERMFGVAENLNRYGAVTLPDLPGFGGMESFYKIGEKPTLDNLADYLAAFVKLQYKRRRVTIMAMSFGFVIVTRMLQRYPELVGKVDGLVSIVGFAHVDDFRFKRRNLLFFRYMASFFSNHLPAWFLKHFVLRSICIRLAYLMVASRHSKLKDANKTERDNRINFEIGLWKQNDIRTYMDTTVTMLTLNICDKRVNLPVHHVAVDHDRYFDNHMVEQHLRVIYDDFTMVKSKMLAHAPTVVADAKAAAPFIPLRIRRLLANG